MTKEQFLQRFNISESQFSGIEEIKGGLYLSSLTTIPEGFNPTVGGGLYLSSLTTIPEGFNPTVGGDLDLRSLTSIPEGFNPTVGGDLDLSSLTTIPEGFNPTVGGDLYLSSLTTIPEGFNPTVGGDLYLSSLTTIPEGFNPTVGGYLDLSSLTTIPEGFNPTVGGDLYLSSLTTIPEGFNPTVGGYLDLRSLTSIPEGFNPTVGGNLDLRSLTTIPEGFNPTVGGGLYLKNRGIQKNDSVVLVWQSGKYISKDGVLTEVVSHKGNVYRVKIVGKQAITYLVTDGNNWAHGETLKEAKEDLTYKITDRRKEDYEGKGLTDVLTHEEAVKCYRVITGACSQGTKHFVTQILNGARKEKYAISEIISLTKGQYGNEAFSKFFQKTTKK